MIRMLDDGQHPQACFVAHSLGTTAVSWMLHDPVGEEYRKRVELYLSDTHTHTYSLSPSLCLSLSLPHSLSLSLSFFLCLIPSLYISLSLFFYSLSLSYFLSLSLCLSPSLSPSFSLSLSLSPGCKRVSSSVLLDPVTFLLCDPTVATSFVYKVRSMQI